MQANPILSALLGIQLAGVWVMVGTVGTAPRGDTNVLPQKLDYPKMLTTWAQQLDPVIANEWIQGQLLTGITLVSGNNAINHKLGRTPNGWTIVSPQATGWGNIYQTSYQINPTLTLTLNSPSTIPCSIWVF